MVKFVYFDVGGVAVRDFSGTDKWLQMKKFMGIKEEDYNRFDDFYYKLQKEIHIGRDVETLVPMIEKEFSIVLPDNFSYLNYFIDRFEKNDTLFPIIEHIRKNNRIGLLTNMYPRMLRAIFDKELLKENIWDIVIDSTIERCQKPDKEIFMLSEKRANVKGEDILFIENSIINIEAAKLCGWNTFYYESKDHSGSCDALWKYLKVQGI